MKIDTFVVPATSEIAAGLKTEKLNGQTLEEVFLSAGAKIGPAVVRRLPGRAERHLRPAEPAAELHQHDQPQLPRPHGAQGSARLSSPAR